MFKRSAKAIIGSAVIFLLVIHTALPLKANDGMELPDTDVMSVSGEASYAEKPGEEYTAETITDDNTQPHIEDTGDVNIQESFEPTGEQEGADIICSGSAEDGSDINEVGENAIPESSEVPATDTVEETGESAGAYTEEVNSEDKENEKEEKIYYFDIPYLESLSIYCLTSKDMHMHGLLKAKGYNELQIAVIMAFADPNAIAYGNFGEYEDSYIKFTKRGRGKLRLWLKKEGNALNTLDERVSFLTEIIPWVFTPKSKSDPGDVSTYEEWLQQEDIGKAASVLIDKMNGAGIVSMSDPANTLIRAQAYYNLFLPETTPRYGLNGIEYYLQYEYTYVPYDKGNIEDSGCGVTCFSMAASHLTGLVLTPAATGYWGYINGADTVTDWSAYYYLADRFGITVEGRYDPNYAGYGYAVEALLNGKLVIASLYGGLFTDSDVGHYILLTGLAGDGTIFVNDPVSYDNSIGRTYTQDEVFGSCAQYWVLDL